MMEQSGDPLSQLARCCFGRRSNRSGGFRTKALRNQYFYSPSMAHLGGLGGPGSTTTWPLAQPAFMGGGAVGPPQPYILFTQPLILATAGDPNQHHHLSAQVPGFVGHPQQQAPPYGLLGEGQPVSLSAQNSPLHQQQGGRLLAPSQYAIYATAGAPMGPAQRELAAIYDNPQKLLLANGPLVRNQSAYLGPMAGVLPGVLPESAGLQQHQQQYGPAGQQHLARPGSRPAQDPRQDQRQAEQRPRALITRELFRQLEVIERQVDLTRDMDLVERHGIVITRAIEAHSLAPLLSEETLLRYQAEFLLGDEGQDVIQFIEIIKRPGQTLGLYIRLVLFESPPAPCGLGSDPNAPPAIPRRSRQGIAITKIESNSPVYTSQVIHAGDEILSVNLIDVRGMGLDDVVTLMSIPKRLVLALRVPRGRDPQLRATYALNHHQAATTTTTTNQLNELRPAGDQLGYAQRARIAANRLQQLRELEQDLQQARASAPPAPFGQSASELNFLASAGAAGQEAPQLAFGRPHEATMALARPARVHSAALQLPGELGLELQDQERQNEMANGQDEEEDDGQGQERFGSPESVVTMRPSDFVLAKRYLSQASRASQSNGSQLGLEGAPREGATGSGGGGPNDPRDPPWRDPNSSRRDLFN